MLHVESHFIDILCSCLKAAFDFRYTTKVILNIKRKETFTDPEDKDTEFKVKIKLFTYGRFLEFSMQHRHQPRYMPEHKLRLLYRNTHSPLQSRRHTSLSHSFHKMVCDLPVIKIYDSFF